MLVDGGINSEHTCINNIMFNYLYHDVLYKQSKINVQ